MTKAQKKERAELVLAMETICRHINNEDILMGWLMNGVADGDITSETTWDDENIEYYYEDDETFAELMGCFMKRMTRAAKDGGLYCDRVVSK